MSVLGLLHPCIYIDNIFKSLVPDITCQCNLFWKLPDLFIVKNVDHECTTSPWEKNLWTKKDLKKFRIKIDQIDRLYFLKIERVNHWLCRAHLLCRAKYDNKYVFVEIMQGYKNNRTSWTKYFLTIDPNIFLYQNWSKEMYRLLREDEYEVDHEPFESEKNNPPSLFFLCNQTICIYYDDYFNQKKLTSQLPFKIATDVMCFIKKRQSIDVRNEFMRIKCK